MTITIDLNEDETYRLRERAARLGVSPEQLARAVVVELLETPSENADDYRRAATKVLTKNDALYRRLS